MYKLKLIKIKTTQQFSVVLRLMSTSVFTIPEYLFILDFIGYRGFAPKSKRSPLLLQFDVDKVNTVDWGLSCRNVILNELECRILSEYLTFSEECCFLRERKKKEERCFAYKNTGQGFINKSIKLFPKEASNILYIQLEINYIPKDSDIIIVEKNICIN